MNQTFMLLLTKSERVMLISILLLAPGAILLYLLQHNIPVNFGVLQPYLETPQSGPNIIGSLITILFIVILPIIVLIRNFKLIKHREPESSLLSRYLHHLIIISTILLLLLFFGNIIIDQYPCWSGVPNCD